MLPPSSPPITTSDVLLVSTVKPDKVSVSQVNSTMIQWSYPPSWSSPSSYFPLRFQVAQLRRGCSGCDDPCADFRPAKVRGTGPL